MISLSPFCTMSCLGDHRTCQVNISDIETGNAIDSKIEEARGNRR